MSTYIYDGEVLKYGKVVDPRYQAVTEASTTRKALSQLAYRWKKENHIEGVVELPVKNIDAVIS